MLLKYFHSILIILLIFVCSCSTSEYFNFNPNNEHKVNFYLSNQNPFIKEPVHIIVKLIYISGEKEIYTDIFNENCSFGEGVEAGHKLQINKLVLKEGRYKLIAETNSNECKLDVDFEISRDQWIYIGYLENDQLKLKMSSSPFIFG